MTRPPVPFEAIVGLLAGLALASFGTGLALALDPALRSAAALAAEPLWWVLTLSPALCAALGWIAGDLRAARESSFKAYQQGVEAEFARLSDQEWVTRAVVTAGLDAVLVVGPDGLVTDANPTAERLFGYPADALVGRPLVTLVPDAPTMVPERFDGDREQVLARHADGSALRLEVRTTRLEHPAVVILTFREDGLRSELEASRLALEQQAGRAQEESRSRALALVDLDRGLRADLSRVLRAAEALRTAGAAAEPVLVAAYGVLERLEQLLDVALWDRTGDRPAREPVPVEELFDEVSGVLAPLAQRWSRQVLVDLDPDLGEVTTDRTLAVGAVRALVREALGRGGGDVVIEVSREPGRDHDWLLVSVPLGRELPPADAEALAAVLESRPTSNPGGAPLVLGQRLARHLGGRITLRPERGERGATFGLSLPLGAPDRARASKVPLARPSPATPA